MKLILWMTIKRTWLHHAWHARTAYAHFDFYDWNFKFDNDINWCHAICFHVCFIAIFPPIIWSPMILLHLQNKSFTIIIQNSCAKYIPTTSEQQKRCFVLDRTQLRTNRKQITNFLLNTFRKHRDDKSYKPFQITTWFPPVILVLSGACSLGRLLLPWLLVQRCTILLDRTPPERNMPPGSTKQEQT